MSRIFAYVGTMGRRDRPATGFSAMCKGGGVYAFEFSPSNGLMRATGMVEAIESSMLASSRRGSTIYSTNECRDFGGGVATGGGVSAYSVNDSGGIALINSQLAGGACTAYAAVSTSGRWILVANHGSHFDAACSYVPDGCGGFRLHMTYDTPSVAVFRLCDDGSVDGMTDLKTFSGAGVRHPAAFIHSVNIDDDNLVYICNKGQDAVELMRLDEQTGKLHKLDRCAFGEATSPRHSALHPTLPVLYVCCEMSPKIGVCSIDRAAGRLKLVQMLATCAPELADAPPTNPVVGAISPSDVVVDPSGRFVYVSNRGRDSSIACYAVCDDGTLKLIEIAPCGANPRGMRVDPTGGWLLVGYMDEHRVASMRIGEDGRLHDEGILTDVPSPCSIRFVSF